MEQSSSHGENEQATSRSDDFKMGYLMGILDGEGSLTVTMHKHTRHNGHGLHMEPLVRMGNTKREITDTFSEYLQHFGIPVYRCTRTAQRKQDKDSFIASIQGWKRMRRFLEVTMPFMMAKKPQAILIKKLVDMRLNGVGPVANPYTTEQALLREEIIDLNKQQNMRRYRSLNDCTRGGMKIADDTVWTPEKSGEAAEMTARQ
jgi:hypothetical protein